MAATGKIQTTTAADVVDEATVTLTCDEWRVVVAAIVAISYDAHDAGDHEAEGEARDLAARIAKQADPERWEFATALLAVLKGAVK